MKHYIVAQGIQIANTNLSEPPTHTCITGGMMCFSVEPKTQNIYILLGRETCFEQMNSTQGQWCDFGGKIHPGESVVGGAAREFAEESLCVVQLEQKYHAYAGYIERVQKMLQDEKYFLKISIILPQKDGIEHARVYYLKEVSWQPNVENKFVSTRAQLAEKEGKLPFSLRNHPSVSYDAETGNSKVDRHFLEKQSIAWWSVDRLSEVVRNNGKYKQHRFRKSFLPVLKIVVKTLCDFYL
jgi:hypothetical protein